MAIEYLERRKEDRVVIGCLLCGNPFSVSAVGVDRGMPYCSYDPDHEQTDRRKSVKCACGKWNCSIIYPPSSAGHNRPSCEQHPTINGVHHTDSTVACTTNHRTPEQEVEWIEDHSKWKTAQERLPDLAAVMAELDSKANPLSFDGHDIFKFVEADPEAAAICLSKMYKTLRRIAIGKAAMAEIPVPKLDRF